MGTEAPVLSLAGTGQAERLLSPMSVFRRITRIARDLRRGTGIALC